MEVYLNIAQIIISAALIAIILVQVRSGGSGSMFGGTESAVYRTRRGRILDRYLQVVGVRIPYLWTMSEPGVRSRRNERVLLFPVLLHFFEEC